MPNYKLIMKSMKKTLNQRFLFTNGFYNLQDLIQKINQFVIMKSLFTLEAQIQGKTIKIQVRENLDIFSIAESIAIEHQLGTQSEEQIMIVILQTLTQLMQTSDPQLKLDICKLLNNTVKKETTNNYFTSNHKKHIAPKQLETKKHKPITLYERGVRLKQQKQKLHKSIKEIQAEKQIQDCTFHPNTNYYPYERINTHQILYNNARMVKEKHQRMRKQKQQHQTDGYTFRPQINQQSVKLAKNRSYNSIKRASFQEEFSYHPCISKGSKKLAQHFPTFQKRLERYMRAKKIQNLSDKENSEATSQVSKNQKVDKYRYMFDDEGKDQERRMRLYGLLPSSCKHENESSVDNSLLSKNSRSEQLFLKKKSRIFEFIYRSVETDQIVNQQSIQDHRLSEQLFNVLQPLLIQISDLQVHLNREQFISSLERLYNSLDTMEKQVLINMQTKKKWEQDHQKYRTKYKFRPTISQRSKDLALRRQLRPLKTFQNQEYEISEHENLECSSRDSRFTIEEQQQDSNQQQIQLI